MINWAARYQPIVKELQSQKPAWTLEVGSGPEGLKMFWRDRVVGVDLNFKRSPIHCAVEAAGSALPFANESSPMVVSCDLLEHIHPLERRAFVLDLSRVARDSLLLAFPSGERAAQVYRDFGMRFGAADMPVWLRQHLEYGLPEADEVAGWLEKDGWRVTSAWYESALSHSRLLRWEMIFPGKFFTYSLMRLMGPYLISRMKFSSEPPYLRVLIKARL